MKIDSVNGFDYWSMLMLPLEYEEFGERKERGGHPLVSQVTNLTFAIG